MRKFVLLILSALCFASCEYTFELEENNLENKLYVDCFATDSDTTFINIFKCVPLNRSTNIERKYPKMDYLRLSSGGRQLSLIQNSSDSTNLWYTLDKIDSKEKLTVEAKAEDTKAISSSCVVPAKPKILSVKQDFCKADKDYMEIDIEIDDNPDTKDYYALVCLEHTVTSSWPVESPEDIMNTDDVYPTLLYSDIYPASTEIFSDRNVQYLSTEWDGKSINPSWYAMSELLGLMDDQRIQASKGHIKAYVYYRADYDIIYTSAGWKQPDGTIVPEEKFHQIGETRRKYKVYRVSEEFYHYVKAEDARSSNALALFGLAPGISAYSNVKDGFGVVAGLLSDETDWMDNIKE